MNDPVRVGILYSATGTTSTIGQSQLQGAQLAIDEINESGGLLGRELVAVRYDPASTPARYAALAEQLIVRDGINVIFGCYMSSSRKAVIPIVEKWNRLLFYPTLYEGFEFSGNVIYTGAAPNQNSVQLADYMTSSFGARVYLIGSDYIYPYESNRIMGELVMQHPGSDKLGEHYLPLDATERDYAAIMQDIRARQPDFIFSTVVGDSTASLYRAYADAGFNPQTMPIASLTTSGPRSPRWVPTWRPATSRPRPTSSPSIHRPMRAAWPGCASAWATTAGPTCAGKPPTFRCTCSPTPSARPAATASAICCPICWAASSTRPRAASGSIPATTTPGCTRAWAAPMPKAASPSCAKPPGPSRPTPIW